MRYLIVLLLAGCAAGGWEKPGSTSQDFYEARGQCVAQAQLAPTGQQQNMILAGCMQGKGWHWKGDY